MYVYSNSTVFFLYYVVCIMKTFFEHIQYASLHYAWIALPIICLILLVLYRHNKVNRIIALLTHNYTHILVKNFSHKKLLLKTTSIVVGCIFLYAALLRPQWNEKKEKVTQEGRDIFVCLDISRSMLVADCSPNRLTVAKNKIKNLLLYLAGSRVGLVLFSGSAFVQCPLTSDYDAFNLFLESVDVENISSGTTRIETALQKVIDVFNTMVGKKNKLVVIFTDGEDFSTNSTGIKNKAQQLGLSVFTVGLGTLEGAPIPLYNMQGVPTGHQKDAAHKVVISRLNENSLRDLSGQLGGTYIKSTLDEYDVRTIADIIKKYEKEKQYDQEITQLQEQYPYFLCVSFICFIIDWLL